MPARTCFEQGQHFRRIQGAALGEQAAQRKPGSRSSVRKVQLRILPQTERAQDVRMPLGIEAPHLQRHGFHLVAVHDAAGRQQMDRDRLVRLAIGGGIEKG